MTQPASVTVDPSGVAFLVYPADESGRVEREAREPGADLSDLPPELQAQITAVWTPDFVSGWQAANHPAPSPEQIRAEALAAIQARRDQAILAFSFAGHPVPLTDKTQQDIGNAVQALARLPAGSTVAWEIVDGVYLDMDLLTVQAMGDAGFAHVQACFANSKALTALLDAAKPYDLESGWPT